MSTKKKTKTDTTVSPSPFAMPFVGSAADALQSAYGDAQQFITAQTPTLQGLSGTVLDKYTASPTTALAGQLVDKMPQADQDYSQIGVIAQGITPNYQFNAPSLSGVKLQQDFLANDFATAGRKAQDAIGGIGTSYTAPTAGLDAIGSQATALGSKFADESATLGAKAAAIPGKYSFDPTGAVAGMGAVSDRVGGIPGQYAYDPTGVRTLGQQAGALAASAAALPGQYTFGAGPVTADTSGLGAVSGAATALGSRVVTPNTAGLQSVGTQASALPGQFSLGDTRNVNVDTSGVDSVAARALALPSQYDLTGGQVGSRSAPVYGAAGAAYALPGQFDLGRTRDTRVDSSALDALSGAALAAGGQRVSPQLGGMQQWEQTARDLPSQYRFGADETDSRNVARDAMDVSADGVDRMSSLSRQIGSIPGQYRVSYDGPNDIIGGEAGQGYVNDVLGGRYLNSNPYIDDMVRQARESAFNDVSSAFGRSGMTGSTNFGSSLGRGIADAETGVRYANYEAERGRMGDAANLDYNFAGLRTGTAANAAGQRMQAQQYNAGNALQAAGLQSELAQSMSSQELQALGIRADIADAIANRTLQGQQYAAQLGLNSAQLGGDLATTQAQMRLQADTANADRFLSGVGMAGDMQGRVMDARLASDTSNADRALTGQRAQADLALGAQQLGGGLVRDAASMDQAAAISDADRSLAGRQAAAALGLDSTRLSGDLASTSMQTRAQTDTANADRALQGQQAQASLALDSLGISRDVAQAIMSGQLDADRVMADLGISALQVQQAMAQAAAQLGLEAQTTNAANTLASQRNAADFALGAGQLQSDALGRGLDAEQLGAGIARDNAATALDAGRLQADLARAQADTTLDYTRAGAETELSAAELAQRALASGQDSQLGALGLAGDMASQSASLQARAAQDAIQNAMQRAGLSLEAQSNTANQQLALLAQQMELPKLQAEFEQARIDAARSQDQASMERVQLLSTILGDRIQSQIELAQASGQLSQADIPMLGAYLDVLGAGASFPQQGAANYASGVGSLLGDYVNQKGTTTQSGGGLGSILGPLLSIGASFIPGVGPALGAASAIGGASKSLGAVAGMRA